ncbi:MAG: membrane protein insertion efficiency factor YidD [Pseudomonadota bacterium]|nr:membrane protein insertion efficiency factor YidD [Pseudomonadota bacterium]
MGPVAYFFYLLIRTYQLFVSPLLGNNCRFSPTCSTYALQCIRRFGALRGSILTLNRLRKCHPFGPYGYDPAPKQAKKIVHQTNN